MKIMSIILSSQVRKKGLGKEKYTPRPAQGRKTGLERKNKQLDPGMEIMSTILDSQARKKGLGKEKYASRPAQGRETGLEMWK